MAAVLFQDRLALALDTLAVLPCILVVDLRLPSLRARRQPATSAPPSPESNSFLQEYISGMGIVQNL